MHAFFDCYAPEVQPTLLTFHKDLDKLREEGVLTFSDAGISAKLLEELFVAADPQVVNVMVRAAKRVGKLFCTLDPRRKTFKPRGRKHQAQTEKPQLAGRRRRRVIESDDEFIPS